MGELAERLADLHGRAFPAAQGWSGREMEGLVAQAGVFVTEAPGGFAMGRVAADEVELLTVAVAPEARRAGCGARLLALFEAEAARRGACEAFLEVAQDNDPARALYLKAGYAEVGQRRGYYRRGPDVAVDAVMMRKDLAAEGYKQPPQSSAPRA
ncbi:GNAT family N-acetyltransferase [Aestuariibius insulae]|uniref:GNAT family N-acetyltransferase n=1 Tax=Aestuariibius insulae TaxID=2058287 RepID=UPI00345EEB5F